MHTLDLVLMLPLALASLRGYKKGLVLEVASFIALILAIVLTMRLTTGVMEMIRPVTGSSRWLPFISYLLTFFGTYLLVIWLARLVEGGVKALQLGGFNKLGGAVLGLLKACFLLSLVFWVSSSLGIIGAGIKEHSLVYRALSEFALNIFHGLATLLPFLKDLILEVDHLLRPAAPVMA